MTFFSLKNIYKCTPQPVVARPGALHQNFIQDKDICGQEGGPSEANMTMSDFIANYMMKPATNTTMTNNAKRPLKTSVGMAATSTAMTSGSHLLFDQSLLLSGQIYLHNNNNNTLN
jgi:hypothetical protein